MKRLKEKAGAAESKIFPYNFRHLFARIYYKVTKDIIGLADLLGHRSINVTRIYTATTETVFQKKLDKIVEQEILECTAKYLLCCKVPLLIRFNLYLQAIYFFQK